MFIPVVWASSANLLNKNLETRMVYVLKPKISAQLLVFKIIPYDYPNFQNKLEYFENYPSDL